MKRTISTEASAAAGRLRQLGIGSPGFVFGGGALDPLTVLGLGPQARWPEVRQAYIARLRVYHPEMQPQEFMRVVEAYDTLKRFFRASGLGASADAAEAGESGGGSCSGGPAKRRRADAAGASLVSPNTSVSAFAGLQECWPMAPSVAPVIALDPTGVGHFGNRGHTPQGGSLSSAFHTVAPPNVAAARLPFGSGFNNSTCRPMDDCGGDDEGGLTRSVSNHMGGVSSSGFGGMLGAPLNVRSGGQPMNVGLGVGQARFFGDPDGNAMTIG